MAAISEFGGGVLLALGLLSPLGSLGICAAMLMAIAKVHWPKGIWSSQGGMEFPLTNLVVALALALAGPGLYALDTALGLVLPEPITLILGLVLVILGVLAALLSQVRPPLVTSQTQ